MNPRCGRVKIATLSSPAWPTVQWLRGHRPRAASSETRRRRVRSGAFWYYWVGNCMGLCVSILHMQEKIPMRRIIELLSTNPARVMGLAHRGTLAVGSHADVTIFDPNKEMGLPARCRSHSKSKNSPFDGWKLQGKVVVTVVGGI